MMLNSARAVFSDASGIVFYVSGSGFDAFGTVFYASGGGFDASGTVLYTSGSRSTAADLLLRIAHSPIIKTILFELRSQMSHT